MLWCQEGRACQVDFTLAAAFLGLFIQTTMDADVLASFDSLARQKVFSFQYH